MGNLATIQACCASSPPVRVVNTDGKVLVFSGEAVRVGDVLRSYPHHYVTTGGRDYKLTRGSMLRDEEVLKPGLTYALQHLPRLFAVRDRKPDPKPNSALINCCACIANGGFTVSPSYPDDNMDVDHCHREEWGVGSLDSTFSMESTNTTGQIVSHSPQKSSPVPSALPLHLQELLKSAEIEWKEIHEQNKPWKPDLDSIKEEPKSPPLRHTLAWLMKVESEMEDGGYDI